MGFSVVIALGPGDRELERLNDLLESLFHYEPGVEHLILVEDALPPRPLENFFRAPSTCRLTVLPNPRRGVGNGWQGGLSTGILAGFHFAAAHTESDFTLKLDTDSLIIAPFAQKITQAFLEHPQIALYGAFVTKPHPPHERPDEFMMVPAFKKLQRPLTIWRLLEPPWFRLQCALYPPHRKLRNLIRSAIANGMRPGQHCQGGGYAVRRNILKILLAEEAFDEPMMWNPTPCSEDIAITTTIMAHGGKPGDLNKDGEPFGVIYQGLLDTPERLAARGFSIIHSVKDFGPYREADTRAYFKQRRAESTPL